MTDDGTAQTIQITVKVFGGLRASLEGGTRRFQMTPPCTLSRLLQVLHSQFPVLAKELSTGLEAGYLTILINGRNVHFLQGRETPLQDDDTVAFLPPVGGG